MLQLLNLNRHERFPPLQERKKMKPAMEQLRGNKINPFKAYLAPCMHVSHACSIYHCYQYIPPSPVTVFLYEPYVPVSGHVRLRTSELKRWEKLMAFAQVHSARNGNRTSPVLSRWCVFLKNFSWQNWLQQPRGSFRDPSTAGGKKVIQFQSSVGGNVSVWIDA